MGLRLEKRITVTPLYSLGVAIFSLVLAFAVFSVVFLQAGINPLTGYKEMFRLAFFTDYGLSKVVENTTVLLLLTLAFIVPLKAGIWNIGAEGQFYMGAIGATGVSFALPNLPLGVLIPLMILGAMASGGAWAAVVGYLKGKIGVNEIVTTLLLNYVATLAAYSLVVNGPWTCPERLPQSSLIPAAGRIPQIGSTGIPCTIFIAIGIAIILFFFLKKAKLGYEIRACGYSPTGARYAGISFLKVSLITMLIGGALAGLAGFHQASGVLGRLRYDISKGWGFYGIVFGLVAGLDPLVAIVVSFFLEGLIYGANALQMTLGMSFGVAAVFIGILFVIFIAGQFFLRYRIKWTRRRRS